MRIHRPFSAVILLFLAACSTSHIIVGKTRTPVDPATVVVYLEPPEHYEQIALVDADSNGSFRFSAQGKIDAAIDRMKKDAAKLGANGVLLRATGEKGSVALVNTSGTASNGTYSGSGVAISGGGLIKSVSGIAIWVPKD